MQINYRLCLKDTVNKKYQQIIILIYKIEYNSNQKFRNNLKINSMKYSILILLMAITLLSACKKDDIKISAINSTYKNFLKNTEWVGTRDFTGFQYPPPCSLKFTSDSTITVYSLFVFFKGNEEIRADSINGTIASIDSLADGRIRVIANFIYLNTQTIFITGKNKMIVTRDATSVPTLNLQLFPAKGISVNGNWSGAEWKGPRNYAYPDLSTIAFSEAEGTTYYIRQGQGIIQYAPNILLKVGYHQRGSRVTMAGYSESEGGITIPYFGVLMPDGHSMLVDSRSQKARLPVYVYTNEPYGPNGITPIVYRQ